LSIHVALRHVTTYKYDRDVSLAPQVVRLRPAPHCRTPILAYSLKIEPGGHFLNWQQDPQSNHLARAVFPERVRELRLEVDLVAEMAVYNPFDFFLEPEASDFPFHYAEWQARELQPFLEREPASPLFTKLVESLKPRRERTVDFLVALAARLQSDISYVIRLEPGVQDKEETLAKGSGSCRDTSWLLVQTLRHLGLAARFVSGYLIQLVPDVKSLDGPVGAASDFTDLHAWCEVYLPGAGWIGVDPTSGLFAGEGHIPLACTPEPSSAAPLTGAVDPCEVEFEHEISVVRVAETPRTTKPYDDAQWERIVALGHTVDEELRRSDVRLTMGGEPTFVSIDDRDGAEWTTEALGANKRDLAGQLLRRLRDRLAPGAFLHYGQGKSYPGEQLPRWALGCYWRRDGEPVWSNPDLLADETSARGLTSDDASRFIQALASRLGVTSACIQAGYEDAYYYLWRERRLPINVDPFDSRIDDEMERERLRRVFGQGLGAVVGYALPLAGDAWGDRVSWTTGPLLLRAGRMLLHPGDSPMGYRLPIDSFPWVSDTDYPSIQPVDPAAPRGSLPPRATLTARHDPVLRYGGVAGKPAQSRKPATDIPARFESAPWVLRTAVCAEARGGNLYVFLPPLANLESCLALVAAVEETAAALRTPVVLEGYAPPRDPRLAFFHLTPDPGVLEVNVNPVASWDELVEQTTVLYEEARHCRLATEKFMLDGRHTGTGGGNHFVLGGATQADSPFLRRPDLLRSLISYWLNHPSLSYLFSGLFIGPTSQAPRVDEARLDSVYELELAFSQLPKRGETAPAWIVDRALRHLLVDVTGNTHRAEFCIDKLFSPDTASGRLGLLEMRAFEMPPHARMSLAQQLLLRGLVARFWNEPYEAGLVRWGTQLHDRFMLPFFVELDFEDVIDELVAAGYPFEKSWFAPHLEFRFPREGSIEARGIELELRQALEPWHVLGEEGSAAGTVRFVDSSVERLQVKVSGLVESRYIVTCNGRPLPLHPTGRAGELVAGVRYRAWQPPSCLHPTIGVNAPLTFDIVDTWTRRSLGGCQYHVAHPGGLAHEQLPVNSYEAESRRLARFFRIGHSSRSVVEAAIEGASRPGSKDGREHPFTLDLRC
jgi:uncharacterized protein (DUF2126 family)